MDPKDVLGGRYELLEQIGCSERAASFHARDNQKRQMVVVKRFDPAHLPADALARYAAAVTLLKRSSLAGAVLPLDVVTVGPTPFAVYSPLVGESVAQLITHGRQCSWLQASDIVARCAGVLSATLTATGQSHRALKPSNLWVSPTGEVSVLDFGIAELGVYALPPRDGPVFVEYRAPEQIDGAAGDARSDVFVLGVLLYELATGVHPFAGSSAFHVARQLLLGASPSVSALTRGMSPGGAREAEKLLARALARVPAERFASAQEFLQALELARRVIGAPSRLAQAAETPPNSPAPTRPVLIVEDPTTIIQPPGLSIKHRANPAPPRSTAPTRPPTVSISLPQPAPPQSRAPETQNPQRVLPEAVVPPSPRIARLLPQPCELAPLKQTIDQQPSPVATRANVLPKQPCERTEVLPSTSRPPIAEHPTERDEVAARPGPLGADEEPQTVAFNKHTVRLTNITAEPTRALRSRVDTSDDPPTAVYSLPTLDHKPAPFSKGPVVEETLLLPSDHTGSGALPAVLTDSGRSELQPVPAPPAPSTHRVLIALNLICVVLVLCGLLLSTFL